MKLPITLAPRDRRALALGVSVLAAALFWRFVAQPLARARAELGARVAEQRGLLARELAAVGTAQRAADDLQGAREEFSQRRARLFPGREPLGATAALVSLVGEEARRRSVQLEAIEPRPADPESGGLVGVRIEVRGRTDLYGLLDWLGALEAGPRLLRLEALTLARIAEPGTKSKGPETLRVGAVIRGYVFSPERTQ